MIQYQQSDSPALFNGAGLTGQPTNAGGTVNRLCAGPPGTQVNSLTIDAHAKDLYAVAFDIPIPNFTLWVAGIWTIRFHVVSANPSVTWNRAYLFRLNSAGQNQGLIGSLVRYATVLGTPGIKIMQVVGEAQPTRSYGDRVIIVLCFTTQGTLPPYNLMVDQTPQTFGFVADQLVDSPFSRGNG